MLLNNKINYNKNKLKNKNSKNKLMYPGKLN